MNNFDQANDNIYIEYEKIISFIKNSQKFGIKLGLETMQILMAKLGNPQDKVKAIHIAGTNGKGSTAAYIESCLIKSGYKVGSYSSPTLFSYEEVIRVNNKAICKKDFVDCFSKVKIACEDMKTEGFDEPTEFEIVTAAALVYFENRQVEFAVIEVGVGGRTDATNIVKPIISVITPIDYDHFALLGNTYSQIAYQKAGIIKESISVVVAKQNDKVMDVIRSEAMKANSKLIEVDFLDISFESLGVNGSRFVFDDKSYITKLIGSHQIENAILALSALKEIEILGFDIIEDALKLGISTTNLPCRIEFIKASPDIILDGAHNPHGIRAMVQAVKDIYPNDKLNIIIGMLADKDLDGMIDESMPVLNYVSNLIITEPINNRRAKADVIAAKIKERFDIEKINCMNIISNPIEALSVALNSLETNDKLIIFGSFYLVAPLRQKLIKSE